jgi:sulfite exporter TauE/SafE/copper chaperone CopZ
MSSNMIKKTLYIDNMTCVNCENIIERSLTGKPGIEDVNASYSNGTVTFTYDEDVITIPEIEEIIKKEGYHVRKEAKENPSAKDQMNYGNNGGAGNPVGKGRDYTNVIGAAIIIFALYLIASRFGFLNIFNAFPVAKEGMGYGMLFLIGMLTSVHCVAMCGGICLSQCVPKNENGAFISKFQALRPSLLYNLGRVISYTVIGAIVGMIGSVVSFSGPMKGLVQILAGVFMVIMGINMLNIFPWLRKFNPRMPKIFAKKIYAQRSSRSPLFIGLLNGLMPCGPLQAMQLYALSTGSPIKGAVSMFLFSVGTVPLMFLFGAISSFLSKKFTAKMMSVSAILVVTLGIFMFNNGLSLSGIALPTLPVVSGSTASASVAAIKDGVQEVTTGLSSGSYEPIVVQKGIPVKWTIQAEDGDINGCNNSIIIQKYGIQKTLEVGDNVIEFTPTDSGTVPFSCWMGMIRSKITVVDDLNNVDSSVLTDNSGVVSSSGGSCCAGGAGSYSGSSSDSGSSGAGSSGSASSGSGTGSDYNNLLDVQIPTDKVAIAEIKDDTQTVELTYDKNGFSPAVVIVQSGLNTVWTINGKNVDVSKNLILFPYYYATLEVKEGENPINFFPDQDFDFYTSDGTYYGYVKVVDDINNIDLDSIKKEIANYKPSDSTGLGSGGGVPSCH